MGPGTDMAKPLFRKPTLDDMGRDISEPSPRGESLFKKNNLDQMTVRRTEKPASAGPLPEKPVDPSAKTIGRSEDDGFRPILRAKAGVGSYEDPGDKRRGKGKSGKPGG
jgi:excinuclease ABC subunit B